MATSAFGMVGVSDIPSLTVVESSEIESVSALCFPLTAFLYSTVGVLAQVGVLSGVLAHVDAVGLTHNFVSAPRAATFSGQLMGAIAWHSSCVASSQLTVPSRKYWQDGGQEAALVRTVGAKDGMSKSMNVFFTGMVHP